MTEGFAPEFPLERLDNIEDSLENDEQTQPQLTRFRNEVDAMAATAAECITTIEPELERLRAQRELLADLGPDTNAALFDQSVEINERYNDAQTRLLNCREIENRSADLAGKIRERITEITSQYMWQRGATIASLLRAAPAALQRWPEQIRNSMMPELGEPLTIMQLFWLLMAVGTLSIGLGMFARLRFAHWYDTAGFSNAPPQLRALLPKPLATHAPMLLLGLGLVVTLYACATNASSELAAVRVAGAIFMVGVGFVIIDWLTGPLSPAAQLAGFYPDHVQPLRLRLRVFVLAIVSSYVVLGPTWLSISPNTPYDPLTKVLMILLLCGLLWWVIIYLGRIRGLKRYRVFRYAALLCVLTAVLAAVLGYYNFASYLTHGAVRTAAAAIVAWILLWLVFSLFEMLVEGKTQAAMNVRNLLNRADTDSRTGFGLFQLSADILIWIGLGVYLIYVWDSSGTTLNQLGDLVSDGRNIGGIKLVPLAIVQGVVSLMVLIALSGWVKRLIDRRWLRHMNLDRGARDAMVTLAGYIGFVIAIFVALNVAGIDLGGLALVGGGLALGIGFGLQAIASNFVSGLILLFERPIKAGDFITVGETEGFVRHIRIRATDIETLDNQNVLVPNSELVSGRVTNWVLRNPQGRLRICVGVAYGTDVELVKSLLEQVGREHEEVISDGGAPAPRGLFMGFGDSSLDFELRVRIRRIEKRYSVISDINFRINQVFAENNIAIPFPQRDLHLISLPEKEAASATAVEPATPEPATPRSRSPERDDLTRHFEQSLSVKCPIERVWTAITDAEQLQTWWAREISIAARIGGHVQATLHDDTRIDAVIDVFMPPRRLRFAQSTPDGERPLPTGPVLQELQLREDADGVQLTVRVSGIPADEDWEGYYRRSESHWESSLQELNKLLRSTKDA
ncbi:MAG: mechanosensitive ion channel domain-containing protein [Pseudomonadota bacterium]